jgi:hypothetical protein
VGAGQLSLILVVWGSLSFIFEGSNLDGMITYSLGLMAVGTIISIFLVLPMYLFCLVIIVKKKIKNLRFYILSGMLTAGSLPMYFLLDGKIDILKIMFFCLMMSLFGILPGKMYHNSCKKYLFHKK